MSCIVPILVIMVVELWIIGTASSAPVPSPILSSIESTGDAGIGRLFSLAMIYIFRIPSVCPFSADFVVKNSALHTLGFILTATNAAAVTMNPSTVFWMDRQNHPLSGNILLGAQRQGFPRSLLVTSRDSFMSFRSRQCSFLSFRAHPNMWLFLIAHKSLVFMM